MSRARETDAKEVIAAIYDVDAIEDSEEASEMFSDIQAAISIETDGRPPWKDMFIMGPLQNFRRIVLAFLCQGMQQMSGISKCALSPLSTVHLVNIQW